MNTALEILLSLQEISHDLEESQATSVTLFRRRFAGRQLEISIEANGRLRGWVITTEITEVMLKGLPSYLTLQRAIQLLQQSYIKFQKEVIEVLPKSMGGGTKHSRPFSALESNKAKTCEQRALQLAEAISNDDERWIVWKAVDGLLKNNPEKKNLNLNETQIGTTGIQALGAALQVNHTLQSLNFWQNQISDIGAQALGTALQVNHMLQLLGIEDNHIGDAGTQALGTALQVNQSLQSLSLWGNEIGDDGAQALGIALQVNRSLQTLDLSNNKIGTIGARALGASLQVNQSLQALDLFNNHISDAGTQALGAGLQVNQSLQSLDLRFNRIGNVGIQALEAALQINDTLQILNFGGNRINAEGIITETRIEILLQTNKQIATVFQQQITQVQSFLQSHDNDHGILLEHLLQLNELLSKWHTDSKNIIPSLQEILRQSGKPNLNDLYKEKLEGIIKDLTNRLHNLWLESFEKKIAALSNEYVMGKEPSKEPNVNLGYALYETWFTFLGSDCPNWVKNRLQSLIPFGVLLDIAEGGDKQDVSELKDPHFLFQRVLSFKNESKDSLFSLTNQSKKS